MAVIKSQTTNAALQVGVPRVVTISPVNTSNSGNPITFGLVDDATYNQVTGSGGWQVVDRPKITSATQWFDRSLWQLSMSLILSSDITNNKSTYVNPTSTTKISVENECYEIENWINPVSGSYEPPVFTISGPVPGVQHYWIIYSVEFGAAIRDPLSGYRYQQEVKLVLYEYSPPYTSKVNSVVPSGFVSNFQYNVNDQPVAVTTYIVAPGDTGAKIASKFGFTTGSTTYQKFLTVNGIRDPQNLVPGQSLVIPGPK